MRNNGLLISALTGALFLFLAATHAAAQWSGLDPFGTNSQVAPAPHMRWENTFKLPEVGGPAPNAELPSAQPLSLPELTEFALRNNPRTRQSWLAARAAAAGVGIERADQLPTITGNYNYTRAQQVNANTGVVVPWQTRFGPSISFSYLLYDFGVRGYQIESTEYRLLAANLSHNRSLQDVIFQVEQAYYRLIGTSVALAQVATMRSSRSMSCP